MIYFVGAGPGATDLITIRGAEMLRRAQVIIYAGSLVNPELLKMAPTDCEIYNSAHMTLDEVIKKLVDSENKKLFTVRLHTGDPSLYGAIREQMDRLKAVDIEYEIVPGVSSFCAAAAAAQVEYTLPGVSQTLIITRMEGRTPVPAKEKLSLLAQHKASMVLFLSTGLLRESFAELIKGGYSADTKVVMVYKASWPEQKILRGTMGTIPDMAEKENIHNTALILIGDFLGDDYELSKLYDREFTHGFRAGV